MKLERDAKEYRSFIRS